MLTGRVMSDTTQLSALKKRLASSLAGRWNDYVELLRRWLTLQLRRDDFEVEARTLMQPDEVALHNEYFVELLHALSKAPGPGRLSTTPQALPAHATLSRSSSNNSLAFGGRGSSMEGVSISRGKVLSSGNRSMQHSYLPQSPSDSCSPLGDGVDSSCSLLSPEGASVSGDPIRSSAGSTRVRKRRPTVGPQPPALSQAEPSAPGLFGSRSRSATAPVLDNQLTMPNVVSFVTSVPQAEMPAPHCSFLMREQAFPESALLYGRMLVVAYEHGLDDIDAATVELMLQGLRSQLLRVISAVIDKRTACKHRKLTRLASGVSARHPDPYRMVGSLYAGQLDTDFFESVYSLSELNLPYKQGSSASHDNCCSLYDLVDALRSERRLICSHTVYTLTMERALLGLRHASHEQLESEHIFAQQKAINLQLQQQQHQQQLQQQPQYHYQVNMAATRYS